MPFQMMEHTWSGANVRSKPDFVGLWNPDAQLMELEVSGRSLGDQLDLRIRSNDSIKLRVVTYEWGSFSLSEELVNACTASMGAIDECIIGVAFEVVGQ